MVIERSRDKHEKPSIPNDLPQAESAGNLVYMAAIIIRSSCRTAMKTKSEERDSVSLY